MKIEYWKGRMLTDLSKQELIDALQKMHDTVMDFIDKDKEWMQRKADISFDAKTNIIRNYFKQ